MFAKLSALDTFLAPSLIRPFYLLGSLLALLWGLVGFLFGLVALVQAPWLGLLVIVFGLGSAGLLFLAVRLIAEGMIAVLRIHARFVGGGPGDPIPE